jgi:hypothetical protein
MKNRILVFTTLALLLGCSKDQTEKINLPKVDQEIRHTLEEYLKTHYMSPEEYAISKFKDHDIVFIGEYHRIKHDLEFIHSMIPKLYENGIFTLGIEFARREDQFLIDSLLKGPVYDDKLAQLIIFNFMVHWGYREYVDIFNVAWQLNQTIPEGSRKFRILGLNDSPDWSLIKTQEDYNNINIMLQVYKGCGEDLWAKVILDEVVAKGEKALIYSGIHHAFSKYNQPGYDEQKHVFTGLVNDRMGNFVYKQIGKKTVTLYLHAPWYSAQGYNEPAVYPADGIIDAVMAKISLEYRRVGFDTRDTPFGRLPGETSIYKYGYSNFNLEMFCDGYIFQMPLSEYKGVTAINGFVNESNIEKARALSTNPSFRNASIEDFYNAAKEDSNIKKRFANFW